MGHGAVIIKPDVQPKSGFTIVELLIVIVVISILAAISIVAYGGIQQKATTASLQSDLTNAAQTLRLFQVDNAAFPTTIDCLVPDSSANKCLKSSGTTSYQYASDNNATPQTFSLTATSGTYSYNTNSENVLSVGGKNLLPNSQLVQTLANNTGLGTAVKMTDENIPYWRVTAVSTISTYENPIYSLPLTVGMIYTISCQVRIPTAGSVSFFSGRGTNTGIPANVWTKMYYTFAYSSSYRIGGNTYAGTTLDYRNWKVETGNTATDWTP